MPWGDESRSEFDPDPAEAGHWAPAEAIEQVENTGLEPVTSWLQTRRSPS
jgi:hypothetical protein